ncbi:MAG: PKD domain-containing protein, partial [Opitutales bacterium]
VTAENDPPEATITSPQTDAVVGTDNLTLSVTAADIDGVLERVEFFANGQKIGEVPNPTPGTNSLDVDFTWAEASAGNFEITAHAVDDDGGIGADTIALQVTRNPIPVVDFDPTPGGAPVRVTFTSEGSYDTDGEVVDYRWDRGEPLGDLSLNGGYVVVEAEHIQQDHRQLDGSGEWVDHYYEVVEDPEASNGQAVQGLPEIGVDEFRNNLDPQGASSSPQLRWNAVSPTDTKQEVYLWVRFKGNSPNSDRIGLGFLGSFSSRFFGGPYDADADGYVWRRTTGTYDARSPTFNVRMEEDGVLIDKVLLTKDAGFTPNGLGPLEETPGVWSHTRDAAFTFTEDGEYTVHLTVTDDLGVTGTESVTITVGEPPNLVFTASPQTGPGPLTVDFDASGTTADARIVRWEWNFGDPESTGEIDFFRPTANYEPSEPSPGSAEVNDQGELHLEGGIWFALGYEYTVTPETRLRFEYRRDEIGELHAIGLDDNAEHDDVTRLFRLDGNGGERAFVDASPPAYDGAGDWVSYDIPIGELYTGVMDRLVFVQLDAGFVDPASSAFRNLELIEPALGAGLTGRHTYSEPGSYTATLTVTDERGLASSLAQTITVAEPIGEPPQIIAFSGNPDAVYEHGRVTFSTEASDSEDAVLSYRWRTPTEVLVDWQSEPRAIVSFPDAGAYAVRAQVRDSDGNLTDASATVQVEAFPGTGTNADLLPDFHRFMATRALPGRPVPTLEDDVDGNGLPLLIDYLFLQPGSGNKTRALPHLMGISGSDVLLRFTRRKEVDPDLMVFFWSDDLAQWHTFDDSQWEVESSASDGNGGQEVAVRLHNMADGGQKFLRTGLELPTIPFSGTFHFEAEDGQLGDNWKIGTDDPEALNGAYIEIDGLDRTQIPGADNPADNVSYAFTVPEGEGGDFDLYYRILSNSYVDDSFFWRLDGGPWIQENNRPGRAVWRKIDHASLDNLDAGEHLFEISYREDGTRLDAFVIQQAGLSAPSP